MTAAVWTDSQPVTDQQYQCVACFYNVQLYTATHTRLAIIECTSKHTSVCVTHIHQVLGCHSDGLYRLQTAFTGCLVKADLVSWREISFLRFLDKKQVSKRRVVIKLL